MSFTSKVESIYANQVQLTSETGTDVDIKCTTGNVLINGALPGGGGGGGLPITGTGDITITGNVIASGDGLTNGRIEGQRIKSIDNIIISNGSLEVTTGGVDIKANGNLSLEGNGDINVLGTGNIGVGTGGITSIGDIETSSGDIVSAGDIFFDGNDIFHRTNNPAAQTSYVTYKQLAQLNAANTFTGANKFDDNVNEFSERISVGTRDGGGLFTQKTAINNSGNIECVSLNNGTAITTGTINCDNGGDNSCAAKTFTTRTSGLAGWTIEQQEVGDGPSGLDNVLQMRGGQAGAYVSIVDSAFSGFVSTIILAPQTEAEGGLIQTDNFRVGDGGANSFNLIQPKSGADANNLLIKSGASGGPIKFQNNAGTTDLVRIEPDSVDGSGRIYCPAIYFGTTGIHNSIVNDVSGAGNLNLKIRQATASSEVLFLDNNDTELIRIQKTQVELNENIPLLFGNYSFRPQQYSRTITLTIDGTKDTTNFTNMIFNPRQNTDWTDVNSGATGQSLYNASLAGYYKCTATQTALSSASNYDGIKVIFDYVLEFSQQTSPDIEPPITFGYKVKPAGGQPPEVDVDHTNNPVQSQPVFLLFPNQNAGETMAMTIKLTKMDF